MLKIIQAIPAPGWFALIDRPEDPYLPLICWALFMDDKDGDTQLEGMVAGGQEGVICAESKEFLTYIHGSQIPAATTENET